MKTPLFKHLVSLLLFSSILFLAFWIRIQSAETLPDGQFLENDGYFYYWQANTIVQQGKLPPRDMHRWMPIGRDNGLLLPLYSYMLAYTYKVAHLFFKDVSLYHVCIYMPTVCFVLGLGVLCFFLYSTFGAFVANTTGILIATLPGTIGRSTVGFGDRDCWCLLLAISAIIFYLIALQTQNSRKRTVLTLISGFFTLLGGLSWEGFGAFLLIIYTIEIWRFLTSESETDLWYYLLWVCSFVPMLYIIAPAYRSGVGFAEHLTTFVLVPPIAILVIRALRQLLITIPQTAETLKSHSRKLSLGLTVLMLAIGLGYLFTQLKNFETTTILMNTPLMHTVSELKNTYFSFWTGRYGSVFIFTALGIKMLAETVENFLNNTQTNKIAAAIALALILFWAPIGGHARFSLYAATQMRTAIPGHGILNDTFAWIKTNLKDGVVAAHWRFGSQLNVLADVKTLIDQDHYLPNWIYLYNQHVHHAKTEREALEYLKTHEATHILVTPDDPHDSLLNKNPFGYRGFKPVFPKTDFAASHIKLWEIQYPPDIETDEKYLETAVPKK